MDFHQRIGAPILDVEESSMSTRICAVIGETIPGAGRGAYRMAAMCQACSILIPMLRIHQAIPAHHQVTIMH